MASPSLFRGVPRKNYGTASPQLAELAKRLSEQVLNRAPVDNTAKIRDIGQRRAELAGQTPTQFSYEAVKNQGALAEAQAKSLFYKQNAVPQMGQLTDRPLPTREDVPLPDRTNNRNEIAARFGASIAGLFNPNVDSSQVIAGGQRKDELAYQQARDNYALAVQKADQKYRDEAFRREQAMNFEAANKERQYKDALTRYGQLEQANTIDASVAGLGAVGSSLSTLDTQARNAAKGVENLNTDYLILQEEAKNDAAAWEKYKTVTQMFQDAKKLEMEGDLANAKIASEEAMVELHKATAANVANETAQSKALFPGKQKEQSLRNKNLESSLQTDALQRGLLGAQIGETKARTNKLNTEASFDRVAGKAANFTAYSNNIKAQLEGPYKVYQDAQKEFDNETKAFKDLWKSVQQGVIKGEITDATYANQALEEARNQLKLVGQRRDQALQNYSSLYTQGQQALRDALAQSPLSRESKVIGRNTTQRKPPPKGLTGKPITILGVR